MIRSKWLIQMGVGALLLLISVGGCRGGLPKDVLYLRTTREMMKTRPDAFYTPDSWAAMGLGVLAVWGAGLLITGPFFALLEWWRGQRAGK